MILQTQDRLTAEELSLILDVSVWTVTKLAKTRQLPCEYRDKRPYFNLEELYGLFQILEGASS